MPEQELLTADEAAAKLRIEKRTVLKWARQNKIESVKLSPKVVLFTAEAIDEFVRSKANKPGPAPMNHQGAGRKTTGPTPKKKGGDRKISGEMWRGLREEVHTWA